MTPRMLTRQEILDALSAVNALLHEKDIRGEICVFGGTAMVLAFDARESTRDVDAVFRPTQEIRDAAQRVAIAKELKEHWLNDGVKGFLSSDGDFQLLEHLPNFSNLHIIAPTPEYLLAMKCMAARVPGYETSGDKRDVMFLVKYLKIKNAATVLGILERYYGDRPLHVKSRFFIEEIFDELKQEDWYEEPEAIG